MTANVFGPGECVAICDEDGDKIDVNPDGSLNVVVVSAPAGSASWEYGFASIAPAASAAIVSFVTVATTRLGGFTAAAEGDGRVTLQINGTTVLVGYLDAAERTITVIPPIEMTVPAATTVELVVDCDATGSTIYEGTVYRS